MREIKYNAIDTDEDDYVRFDDWLNQNYELDRTHNEDLAEFLLFHYGCKLLQYTGLKDKNGVEIYEADICKITSDHNEVTVHEVRYMANENYPAFDLFPLLGTESNGFSEVYTGGYLDIEVIGNKFENPELLNV